MLAGARREREPREAMRGGVRIAGKISDPDLVIPRLRRKLIILSSRLPSLVTSRKGGLARVRPKRAGKDETPADSHPYRLVVFGRTGGGL